MYITESRYEEFWDTISELKEQIEELQEFIADAIDTVDMFLEEGDRDELIAWRKYIAMMYEEKKYG